MMNRTCMIGIAAVVVVLIGLVVIVPAVMPQDSMASMTVTFYDKNDTPVYSDTTEPTVFDMINHAFTRGGVEIEYVIVKFTFTVTSSEDLASLSVVSGLTATTREQRVDSKGEDYLYIVNTKGPLTNTFAEKTYSHSLTLTIAELIPNPTAHPNIENGWSILFSLHLDATGVTTSNKALTASFDTQLEFGINWITDTYDFSITGTLST